MENNKEIEYRKQVAHDNYIKLMGDRTIYPKQPAKSISDMFKEEDVDTHYEKVKRHDNYIKLMNSGYITSYNNLEGQKVEKVNNSTKEAIHDNYMKIMNGGYKTSIVKDEDVKGL